MGSGQTARFDRPYSNTIFTSGQGGIIMAVTQQILLTAPPADCQRAMAYGVPVAHMAYRVGPGRASLPLQPPAYAARRAYGAGRRGL